MRKAAVSACLVSAALCALRAAAGGPGGRPPGPKKFEKVTLNDRPGEPVSLAVLPDRRVLHTARGGQVRLFDPRTQLNKLAADVDVYSHDEEGLQGIAIDPNFEDNHWVYLYYSPPGRHARGRPDDADLQRGRRPVRERRPERLRGLQGRAAPVALQARGAASSTWTRSRRSSTCRSTAASAATSAARSTSTRRATCTCPPATTRTRSSPTATRRSTTARTATRRSTPAARPATRTTCAASCCGSGPRPTAATTSRPGTCSRAARRRPSPRST